MSITKSEFYLFTARLASMISKRQLAAELVLKSIKINPAPQPAHYRRAANFLRLNKQNSLAKEYDLLTINSTPKSAVDITDQAKAYFTLGRTNEALATYQVLAREYNKPFDAYYAIGLFYQKTSSNPNGGGRWRAVVDSFETAISANPKSIRAFSLLGEAYLELDEPISALRALEQANKLLPNKKTRLIAKRFLAISLKIQERFSKKKKLKSLIARVNKRLTVLGFGPRAVAIWYDLGRCYELLENKEKSDFFYSKAVEDRKSVV